MGSTNELSQLHNVGHVGRGKHVQTAALAGNWFTMLLQMVPTTVPFATEHLCPWSMGPCQKMSRKVIFLLSGENGYEQPR